MVIGKVIFDKNFEEGELMLNKKFHSLPLLLQLDLLQDIMCNVENIYDDVHENYSRQYKAKKEIAA